MDLNLGLPNAQDIRPVQEIVGLEMVQLALGKGARLYGISGNDNTVALADPYFSTQLQGAQLVAIRNTDLNSRLARDYPP